MSQPGHAAGIQKAGTPTQTGDLIPLLYDELRTLAGRILARSSPGQRLQACALVHEAYLRLARCKNQTWANRAHFFAAAAEAMRRILTEESRRRMAQRRSSKRCEMNLDEVALAVKTDPDLVLLIQDALERLAAIDPVKAELVKLRFFGGLSIKEVSQFMGLAERTVKWHWTSARAWLRHELITFDSNGSTLPDHLQSLIPSSVCGRDARPSNGTLRPLQ